MCLRRKGALRRPPPKDLHHAARTADAGTGLLPLRRLPYGGVSARPGPGYARHVAVARRAADGGAGGLRLQLRPRPTTCCGSWAALRVETKQVERAAEALGREVADDERAVAETVPSPAPTMYLGLDGSGVPVRPTRSKPPRQAAGRFSQDPRGQAGHRVDGRTTRQGGPARTRPRVGQLQRRGRERGQPRHRPAAAAFAQRAYREAIRRGCRLCGPLACQPRDLARVQRAQHQGAVHRCDELRPGNVRCSIGTTRCCVPGCRCLSMSSTRHIAGSVSGASLRGYAASSRRASPTKTAARCSSPSPAPSTVPSAGRRDPHTVASAAKRGLVPRRPHGPERLHPLVEQLVGALAPRVGGAAAEARPRRVRPVPGAFDQQNLALARLADRAFPAVTVRRCQDDSALGFAGANLLREQRVAPARFRSLRPLAARAPSADSTASTTVVFPAPLPAVEHGAVRLQTAASAARSVPGSTRRRR